MTTPELEESDNFLDPALLIPVKGKVYRIEPMSAESAILLQKGRDAYAKAEAEGKSIEEMKDIEIDGAENESGEKMYRRLFGDAYDEMISDGVNHIVLFRMSQIVMTWAFYGLDAAKAFVATGGKAVTMPNREARRTATRNRSVSATTTRKRASVTGTSTPKATAKAASGKTSSPTGTPSKPTSKNSA